MQSNNPVFRRSEAFSGSGAHGNQSYGNSGYGSDPSQWGVGTPGDPQGTAYAPAPQAPSAPMTIDSVVQKTAITLGVVVVTAFATWVMLPEINESTADSAIGTVGAVATFGALGAFVLSMVNAFKKVVSPGLVLAFAALEGVALGAISMIFNVAYPGVVQGAVLVVGVAQVVHRQHERLAAPAQHLGELAQGGGVDGVEAEVEVEEVEVGVARPLRSQHHRRPPPGARGALRGVGVRVGQPDHPTVVLLGGEVADVDVARRHGGDDEGSASGRGAVRGDVGGSRGSREVWHMSWISTGRRVHVPPKGGVGPTVVAQASGPRRSVLPGGPRTGEATDLPRPVPVDRRHPGG